MHIFDYQRTPEELLTPEVVQLLSGVHEHKGRQMILLEQFGSRLIPLRTEAERQSGRAAEISSDTYRACLEMVRGSFDVMRPEPAAVRDLHRILFPEGAGKYREHDSVISELDDGGEERERFRPCKVSEVNDAVDQLFAAFNAAVSEERHDPLILIAMFVIDFLSIHPFEDGNGKIVWLMQTLLLYRAGYYISAYVSLERLTEESDASYKEALQYSSIFWQDGTNSYEPFVCWFLSLLNRAYTLFEKQTGFLTGTRMSKKDRIREAVRHWGGPVTKRALLEAYPDIAVVTVERALAALVRDGTLVKQGGGPSTSYVLADHLPA